MGAVLGQVAIVTHVSEVHTYNYGQKGCAYILLADSSEAATAKLFFHGQRICKDSTRLNVLDYIPGLSKPVIFDQNALIETPAYLARAVLPPFECFSSANLVPHTTLPFYLSYAKPYKKTNKMPTSKFLKTSKLINTSESLEDDSLSTDVGLPHHSLKSPTESPDEWPTL